jgi:hypothetical protein
MVTLSVSKSLPKYSNASSTRIGVGSVGKAAIFASRMKTNGNETEDVLEND